MSSDEKTSVALNRTTLCLLSMRKEKATGRESPADTGYLMPNDAPILKSRA